MTKLVKITPHENNLGGNKMADKLMNEHFDIQNKWP